MVNTILEEADLFCPNSVRINFTIYHIVIEAKCQLEILNVWYFLYYFISTWIAISFNALLKALLI
ncbi:hypothetical protein LpLQ80_16050 (plasmid) [Lactiplantibacillus plantarum]|nr:hypothetical protein LpLQ80_16050 [Lactiplantibacillus plantarum]